MTDGDLSAVCDHDHNLLGQALCTLTLYQDVIYILLLYCDFETLVLVLQPKTDIGQEFRNDRLFFDLILDLRGFNDAFLR